MGCHAADADGEELGNETRNLGLLQHTQEERRFWGQGQGPEMRFSEIRLLIIMSTVGGSCDRFHPVVEAVTVTNLGVTVTNRKL